MKYFYYKILQDQIYNHDSLIIMLACYVSRMFGG